MAIHPSEALAELFQHLEALGAGPLAEDMRAAIARGTIEPVEIVRAKEELSRQPLSAEAAYHVAAAMLVAAVDPLLMLADVRAELAQVSDDQSSLDDNIEIVWKRDTIEGSPVEPLLGVDTEVPQVSDGSTTELRSVASALARLLDVNGREGV